MLTPVELVPYAFYTMISMFFIAWGLQAMVTPVRKMFARRKPESEKINEAIIRLQAISELVPDQNFKRTLNAVVDVLEED